MATRKQLDAYSAATSALRKSCVNAVHKQLKDYLKKNPQANIVEIREWGKAMMGELCESYSLSAQAIAADFYEELTSEAAQKSPAYVDYDAIDRAVRYQATKLVNKNKAGFVEGCARYLGEIAVNKTVNQTMINQVILGKKSRKRTKSRGGDIRWFRVPCGPEPCTLCVMLASRKDGYLTYESAGGKDPDHFHSGCKCKVVPAKTADDIEGFDPDEYLSIYRHFELIDSYGLPRAQEEALKYAHLDRVRPQGGAVQQSQGEYADALEEGIQSALKAFRKQKTRESYDETVGRFLELLGDEYGIELSGENFVNQRGKVVGADPNGEELWVAVQARMSGQFLYAATEHKCPDMRTDTGLLVEFKTPKAEGKINRLLCDAARKYDSYPDETRSAIISLLRIPDCFDAAVGAAKRFTDDGTLDLSLIHI